MKQESQKEQSMQLRVWNELVDRLRREELRGLSEESLKKIMKCNQDWALKARLSKNKCPSEALRDWVFKDEDEGITDGVGKKMLWYFLRDFNLKENQEESGDGLKQEDMLEIVLQNVGFLAGRLSSQEDYAEFERWNKIFKKEELEGFLESVEGSIVQEVFRYGKCDPKMLKIVEEWMDREVNLEAAFGDYVTRSQGGEVSKEDACKWLELIRSHPNEKYKKIMSHWIQKGSSKRGKLEDSSLALIWDSIKSRDEMGQMLLKKEGGEETLKWREQKRL